MASKSDHGTRKRAAVYQVLHVFMEWPQTISREAHAARWHRRNILRSMGRWHRHVDQNRDH
jgi:hypothetical protein